MAGLKPLGLAVFADINQVAPAVLLPALTALLADREDLRVEVVYLVGPPERTLRRHMRRCGRFLQVLLGSGKWERSLAVTAADSLAGLAQRGVPVRVLPDGDPNAPEVRASLRDEFGVACGLNLYCMRRFEPPLLSVLRRTVNYHNGTLPGMRGLRASNWSIYLGHSCSGYAFHVMTEEFDGGRILAQGEVPVVRGETPADLEFRKAKDAADRLGELVDALVSGASGKPQQGMAGYFSRAKWLELSRVSDPSNLTVEEWRRRLDAFLYVDAWVEGRWLRVTAVRRGRRSRPPGFATADGEWLQISAIAFWPTWACGIVPGVLGRGFGSR